MTPSRKARTRVHVIKAANAPIIRPATGGMLHLTFEMHACGEGLNKRWLSPRGMAAVQVVELTAGLRTTRFLAASRRAVSGNACRKRRSKPQRHPDVTRLESEPLVEALRVDAGVVGEQFDQPAFTAARRCRGCGNGWRRERPRSARARRPANSIRAGCKAAGSRPRRGPARRPR